MTPLTAAEAAALTERAVALAHELNGVLTELHERDAAGALGMTWREYIDKYFGMSPSWFYDTLKVENIRAKLQSAGVLGALDTLSKRAALALAKLEDDIVIQAYEAAAQNKRPVTETAIVAASEAIREIVQYGVVDIGGEQHTVKGALALSVQAAERERVNAGREYLAANVEAWVENFTRETITITVKTYTQDMYWELDSKQPLRISIWRDAK